MLEIKTGSRWLCVSADDPSYAVRHRITSVATRPEQGKTAAETTEVTTWSDLLPAHVQQQNAGISGYAWQGCLNDFLKTFRPL
jgi:hypothetical protein